MFYCFVDLQFEKPGKRQNFDYPDMAKEAAHKALADAKIHYNEVQQAVCGYVYGLFLTPNITFDRLKLRNEYSLIFKVTRRLDSAPFTKLA